LIDADYVRRTRSINFSWEAVSGASGYLFTLYKETPSGRQEALRAGYVAGTSYILDDVRRLGEGSFVWQVEGVNRTGGAEQRGNILEHRFTITIQLPKDPQVQDTGTLYGTQE
jgi:hypothetical protein